MMMLNPNPKNIRTAGILCGEIIGVQVMGNDLRLDTERCETDADALFERFMCFNIAHIANVMTQKRITVTRQTEGILELASYGERWFCFKRQSHRVRRISTERRK